jgi:histidinol-phosphate aminotransferase
MGDNMSEYNIGQSIEDVKVKLAGTETIKIHKMSSNENPFGPSPKAVTAIQDSLAQLNHYPQRSDSHITKLLAQHFGRDLTADNFTTANGAVDIINLLEEVSFAKDSSNSILICPPCFGSYAATAKLKGATVIEHPLNPDTFDIDLQGMAAAINSDTRLVYICNPNNPTGSFFDQGTLTKILELLPAHVTLVYDEVYYHYATEFTLPDAIAEVVNDRNIVILHSFSKAYGLAGLRIGYAIASTAMITRLNQHKLSFQNDTLSMAAIGAAIADQDYLDKVVSNNTEQRSWLREQLSRLNIQYWPSQSNFICFKAPANQSAAKITQLLVNFGIMVRPAFYLPNHVRVSVGLPEANQQFIEAMKSIMEQLDTQPTRDGKTQ